jgi:hypothetical protein
MSFAAGCSVSSRGAAQVGNRTVDVLAVKSSCNVVKNTYPVVALLAIFITRSLISDFRCTTRA